MTHAAKKKRLRALQSEIDRLRSELNIGARDEVLYCAPLFDDEVIVIADGLGGATTSVVDGNYPIDFITRYEKDFRTEAAALRVADKLIEKQIDPADVLGDFRSHYTA